jgi:plasmid replication initiation protein
MSSKYAISLYEMVQLRGNMDRCMEAFALDRFRDLLGVPPSAYERGNDLVKRVIDPAVIEVNGLSEYGVRVDVERPHSRAPITGVVLGWWRKHGEEFRATYQERQRSKLGRMARLRGQTEQATISPALALFPTLPAPVPPSRRSSSPVRLQSGRTGRRPPA